MTHTESNTRHNRKRNKEKGLLDTKRNKEKGLFQVERSPLLTTVQQEDQSYHKNPIYVGNLISNMSTDDI